MLARMAAPNTATDLAQIGAPAICRHHFLSEPSVGPARRHILLGAAKGPSGVHACPPAPLCQRTPGADRHGALLWQAPGSNRPRKSAPTPGLLLCCFAPPPQCRGTRPTGLGGQRHEPAAPSIFRVCAGGGLQSVAARSTPPPANGLSASARQASLDPRGQSRRAASLPPNTPPPPPPPPPPTKLAWVTLHAETRK
jgi:hypothetical protein